MQLKDGNWEDKINDCLQADKLQLTADLQKSERLREQKMILTADIEKAESDLDQSHAQLAPLTRWDTAL